MFSSAFLKATAERAVRAFAAALISLWVVGDQMLDVFAVDWERAAGVGLGAAVVSILLSLVGSGLSSTPGPSLLGTETTARAVSHPNAPYTGGH